MKYRKKSVVIEAVQWTGDRDIINNFIGLKNNPNNSIFSYSEDGVLLIKTLESGHGMHTANIGDYIIKGVKGEFYPCKPDIFAMTYEPVVMTWEEAHEDL